MNRIDQSQLRFLGIWTQSLIAAYDHGPSALQNWPWQIETAILGKSYSNRNNWNTLAHETCGYMQA